MQKTKKNKNARNLTEERQFLEVSTSLGDCLSFAVFMLHCACTVLS